MSHYVIHQKLNSEDLTEVKVIAEFMQWYGKAKPFDKYTYHVGACLSEASATWKLKLLVWQYATKGWIYLAQRKITLDQYEFIAYKASQPNRRLIPHDTGIDHPKQKVVRSLKWQNSLKPSQKWTKKLQLPQ
jgi:hypothetical protein